MDLGRHLFFSSPHHADGPTLLVGFHLFGTSDQPILPDSLVARLVCHALVQRLPESGLAEALETRGFGGPYRTPLAEYRFRARDWALVLGMLAATATSSIRSAIASWISACLSNL